jgi:hypothetical protein
MIRRLRAVGSVNLAAELRRSFAEKKDRIPQPNYLHFTTIAKIVVK